jgi:hypothetical protein
VVEVHWKAGRRASIRHHLDAAPRATSAACWPSRDFVEAAAQRCSGTSSATTANRCTFALGARALLEIRGSSIRRRSTGVAGGIALGLGGFVLLGIGVYWLRRQRRSPNEPRARVAAEDVNLTQIVALYRLLDAAMATRAIGRPPSTPPLAHARSLLEMGHPAGREILELTQIYVEARFGGRGLDEEERRDFARRVKLLRQTRDEIRTAA